MKFILFCCFYHNININKYKMAHFEAFLSLRPCDMNGHIYGFVLNEIACFANEIECDDVAKKYFRISAEYGTRIAITNFGACCFAEKNFDEAKKYFEMAIEKGCDIAMANLGLLYHKIEKDYAKATKYYSMAIKNGFTSIKYLLEILDQEIWTEKIDILDRCISANKMREERIVNVVMELSALSSVPSVGPKIVELKKSFLEIAGKLSLDMDVEEVKKAFPNHNKNDIVHECLVCKSNKPYMFNLKCKETYDHCYCVMCFHGWYKTNAKKCIVCFANICLDDVVFIY